METLPFNINHARQSGRFVGTDHEGVEWFIQRLGGRYFIRRMSEPTRVEYRSLTACSEAIARSY